MEEKKQSEDSNGKIESFLFIGDEVATKELLKEAKIENFEDLEKLLLKKVV